MNRYGELIAPDTVRFQRLLPGTLDTVWSYLVDGEKRGKWLAHAPRHPGRRARWQGTQAVLEYPHGPRGRVRGPVGLNAQIEIESTVFRISSRKWPQPKG